MTGKRACSRRMTTDMKNLDQLSLVEMKQFVEGSRKVEFKPGEKDDT